MSWKFLDPPNVAVFTHRQIMKGEEWIAYVSHDDDDGCWQFLGPGNAREEDASTVGLKEIFDLDNSIGELADLPEGWHAWREAPSEPWRRGKTDWR